PAVRFGPVRSDVSHFHSKNGHLVSPATLLVAVLTNCLADQRTDQAGFFPGFSEGGRFGGFVRLDVSLGDDPLLAAAAEDQADHAVLDGKGRRLLDRATLLFLSHVFLSHLFLHFRPLFSRLFFFFYYQHYILKSCVNP